MNSQETMNLLRQVLTFAGAYLTARGVASHDQVSQAISDLTTLVPAVVSLGSIFWSVYAHWNMKKVPQHAVAIDQAVPSSQAENFHIAGKIVGAVVLGVLLWPSSSMAKPFCVDPLNKIPVGCVPATAVNVAKSLNELLQKPMQDLANFIQGDFTQAQSLATSIPDMPDGNGQACWSLLLSANAIFKQNNTNAPLPGAATVLEQLRLLTMVANRVCQNAACTQVFTEAGNALNTAAPIPNLPNLTDLCSKVPAVAQVAATTAAPVTVAPEIAPAK